MANVLGQVSVPDLLNQFAWIIPTISSSNVILVELIKKLCKLESQAAIHWISYITAILIGLGFYFFNGLDFGLSATWNIICSALTGLAAGAISNSVFDWKAIQDILSFILNLFFKKA